MSHTALRCNLKASGFPPLPINGKRPPMKDWSALLEASEDVIKTWERAYPYAASTGILTALNPALDVDILNPEACEAVEQLIRARYEEAGRILVRFGARPKFAVLFRTDQPFAKITVNLIAPNGASDEQKLEFLASGQQIVAFGRHVKTGEPYAWFGGEPGTVKREDLPYVDQAQAQQLINDAADLLCADFGYQRAAERPRKSNGATSGAEDWAVLAENIRKGHALHDSLRDLAAKLVTSGMDVGAAINFLRGMMDKSEVDHDDRWKERRDDIPRLVESAAEKPTAESPPRTPQAIDQVLSIFERWLLLRDTVPVYAVLGTVAANLLVQINVFPTSVCNLIAPCSR
jgi:hypothetical protein